MPKAVLRKLVLEMQVPSKLMAAYKDAAADAFAVALHTLLLTILQPCMQLTDSWFDKLSSSILQQLLHGQLPQVLSALLTGSAQQLWDLQQLPPQQLAAALADPACHTLRGSSSAPRSQCCFLRRPQERAGYLLGAVHQLLDWSCHVEHASYQEFGAALAGPTLLLSLLAMQHGSTCLELLPAPMQPVPQQRQQQQQDLQQQPQQQQQPKLLQHLLTNAQSGAAEVMCWAADDQHCSEAVRMQLLQAPYCLPAVCSCVLLLSYSSLLGAEHTKWQRSGAKGDWSQLAWQLAWHGQHKLLVAQEELLRLTGCSSKALLWTAALSARSRYQAGFSTTSTSAAAEMYVRAAVLASPAGEAGSALPEQQQHNDSSSPGCSVDRQEHRAMLFLMPVAVLHWASHALAACDSSSDARDILNYTALVCGTAGTVLAEQQFQPHKQQQQQTQQPQQQQQQQQESEDVCGQQAQWESLPPDWRVLSPAVYLQVLHEALGAAGRLLQDVNSSSRWGSSAGSTPDSAAEWNSCCQQLLEFCFHHLLSLSSEAMGVLTGEALKPSQWAVVGPADPVLPAYVKVWSQHSAQLCATLEAAVRQQAALAAPAAGALPSISAVLCGSVIGFASPACCCKSGVCLAAAAAAGPGSEQQLQLYSLLRSLLKWAQGAGQQHQRLAEELRTTAAVAATNLLVAAASTAGREVGGCSCDDRAGNSGSTSCAGGSGDSSLLQALPWLGVLACCCLQWAQQLQQLPPADPKLAAMAAASIGLEELDKELPRGILGRLFKPDTASQTVWNMFFETPPCLQSTIFLECMRGVAALLRAGVAVSELGAAGYGGALQALQQQLDGTLAAISAAAPAEPRGPWALGPVVQQLSSLGLCLSSFAHKRSCNNPACSSLAGPSELQLVRGGSSTCSGCRVARYCSAACVRQHWKQHKPVCKALAAATAGAAAGGGAAGVAAAAEVPAAGAPAMEESCA